MIKLVVRDKNFKLLLRKWFKSYVDMANFLDKHKEYANKEMFVWNSNQIGLPTKVKFDGVWVWVENYGFI